MSWQRAMCLNRCSRAKNRFMTLSLPLGYWAMQVTDSWCSYLFAETPNKPIFRPYPPEKHRQI